MSRYNILKSPAYWASKIQLSLYEKALSFMQTHHLNKTGLARHLGVSKGYVSQLMSGDYDHRLSKFVELSLSFGYIPKIEFIPIADKVKEEQFNEIVNSTDYCGVYFSDYTKAA